MSDAKATELVVLEYFQSWQEPTDLAAFRACLADDVVFDSGISTMEGGDALTDMVSRIGSPWRDVTLLASIFTAEGGALFYEGIDVLSGNKTRVGEHITVKNGLISHIVSSISSVP